MGFSEETGPIFNQNHPKRSKSKKNLILRWMFVFLGFLAKPARNRSRYFPMPLLLESNFILMCDHQKCIFGSSAFFLHGDFGPKSPERVPPTQPTGLTWERITFYWVRVEKRSTADFVALDALFRMSIGLWGLFPTVAAPAPRIDQKRTLIFCQILDP